MSDLQKTTEEVLSVLADKVKDSTDDFRVRVERRRTSGSPPELVASFDGGRIEHAATPEAWLPQLAGGGLFTVKFSHASEVSRVIGMIFVTIEAPSKSVDQKVVASSNWKGPSIMIYPAPKVAPEDPVMVSAAGDSAMPRTSPDGAGGGNHLSEVERRIAGQYEQIQRAQLALAEKQKQLEVEAARKEADMRVRAAEERTKDLERRMDQMLQHPPTPPPPPPAEKDNTTTMMLMEMRKSDREMALAQSQKDREFQLEMAKLQAAQAAAQAAAQQAAAAQAAESNKMLMQALFNKPAIDPVVQEMLAKNDSSQLIASMSTMLTNTASQHLNMMSAMMDMGLGGGREAAAPRPAKENGWASAAKVLLPLVQRAIAAPAPAPQPIPAQAQVVPAQQVVEVQPVVPAVPSGIQTSAPTPPGPAAPVAPPAVSVVAQIVGLIRGKQPPTEIAKTVLTNLSDADLLAAVTAAGGDPRVLFDNLLGEWLDDLENRKYCGEIIRQVLQQGVAAGVLPAEAASDVPGMVASFIESEPG